MRPDYSTRATIQFDEQEHMHYHDFETEIGLPNGSASENYQMMRLVSIADVLAQSSRQPANRPMFNHAATAETFAQWTTPMSMSRNVPKCPSILAPTTGSKPVRRRPRRRRSPDARGPSQCPKMPQNVPQFKPQHPLHGYHDNHPSASYMVGWIPPSSRLRRTP